MARRRRGGRREAINIKFSLSLPQSFFRRKMTAPSSEGACVCKCGLGRRTKLVATIKYILYYIVGANCVRPLLISAEVGWRPQVAPTDAMLYRVGRGLAPAVNKHRITVGTGLAPVRKELHTSHIDGQP